MLIVEDNPDAALTTAMLLKALGYDSIIAPDGAAALEAMGRERIDLVLLDLGLPGIDGYEVARRIRAQPAYARLPIVCLSAHAFPEHRAKALEAGCDDHLTKPVELDLLKRTLAKHLPAAGQ